VGESAGFRWGRRIALTLLASFVTVPLLVVVLTSLTPLADLQESFRWVPGRLTPRAYLDMWSSVPLARYLLNSLVVSTSVTAATLVVALPAGYALARQPTGQVRGFGLLLLATQAAPGMLFLLPLVLVYAKLSGLTGVHLAGTYPGLIITELTFALPASIWILALHVAALPDEVEDAARLDGAGTVRLLLRIVAPQAIPGLLAAGLFSFLTAWGEVLFATVLSDARTETVPVGLHDFATQSTVYWNQLTAAALTTSLPVVLAFLALERLVAARTRTPAGG
jgi:multiple sugar transport system permease protein